MHLLSSSVSSLGFFCDRNIAEYWVCCRGSVAASLCKTLFLFGHLGALSGALAPYLPDERCISVLRPNAVNCSSFPAISSILRILCFFVRHGNLTSATYSAEQATIVKNGCTFGSKAPNFSSLARGVLGVSRRVPATRALVFLNDAARE